MNKKKMYQKKNSKKKRDFNFLSLSYIIPTNRGAILFWISMMLYLIYQAWSLPHWSFGGDMWAEMATNYYHNSISSSIYNQLLSTDAGYLPLPPRLIAFAGAKLGFSALIIPYYYTWISALSGAILVSIFCLPLFRVVVKSDLFRFCFCIINLGIIRFEQSTIVNIFYLSAFFITIVSLYAYYNTKDVPVWFWLTPLLVVSKPAVLATIPLVIISAFYSCKRFKKIALVTCLAGFLQIFQMWYSRTQLGIFSNERIVGEIFEIMYKHFFVFLGKYVFGNLVSSFEIVYYLGIFVLLVSIFLLVFLSSKYRVLVFYGLILVFLNNLLNSVAVGIWDCKHFDWFCKYFFFARGMWVIFIGISFLIAGYILIICEKFIPSAKWQSFFSVGLLLLWFFITGWSGKIRTPANEPRFIFEWQKKVKEIGNKKSVIININPIFYSTHWKYEYVNPMFSE